MPPTIHHTHPRARSFLGLVLLLSGLHLSGPVASQMPDTVRGELGHRLDDYLTRLVFGASVSPPPRVVPLATEGLARFTGRYRSESGDVVRVAFAGSGLQLTGEGPGAADLLSGGGDPTDDPERLTAGERSLEILRRAFAGDFTGIHQAFGGGMSLEEVATEEGRWMAMRRERFGEVEGVEVASSQREGPRVHVYLRILHEHGTGYLHYVWAGGGLVGVELTDELPGAGPKVYPVSETEFESFSLRDPFRIRVGFEIPAGESRPTALLIHTDAGDIRLRAG